MGRISSRLSIAVFAILAVFFPLIAHAESKDNGTSLVITFKDGHQQTIPVADIARMEFKLPPAAASAGAPAPIDLPSRHHFLGQWTVTDNAGHTYLFTLKESGEATNNVDSGGHGTWSYENGEARITWDNGWHDIIRKVGMKYRKFAFAPGKTFDDTPTNEGSAHKTNPEPI